MFVALSEVRQEGRHCLARTVGKGPLHSLPPHTVGDGPPRGHVEGLVSACFNFPVGTVGPQ
eukprot:6921012-Pyramimonas_sp.AAC.1